MCGKIAAQLIADRLLALVELQYMLGFHAR